MPDLTEMAQRILSELEEIWDQNVFSMLNTVVTPNGEAAQLAEFQAALAALVERDYVLMGYEGFVPRNPEQLSKERSLEMISSIPEWFAFDEAERFWTLSKGPYNEIRYPGIYSTQEGRDKAFEILDRRGYQWWRVDK